MVTCEEHNQKPGASHAMRTKSDGWLLQRAGGQSCRDSDVSDKTFFIGKPGFQ